MRPQRLREGIKRARRILRVRRMTWRRAMEWWPNLLSDGGEQEHHLRFTQTPCSCSMCGNPRRHWGTVTVQERRADEEMRFQLYDWEYNWDADAWRDWHDDQALLEIENVYNAFSNYAEYV